MPKEWCPPCIIERRKTKDFPEAKTIMIDLNEIKVTPRDQQVLNLLVQGCSNKEIAGQLNISPRTVKQHLRTLFLRAGIREGRKRVKLAIAMFSTEEQSKDGFSGDSTKGVFAGEEVRL
jgi:DNA-binding NarL/FixJ family response regulator